MDKPESDKGAQFCSGVDTADATTFPQVAHTANELASGIKRIEAQIEQLLDRIVDASNDSVISAYEKRIGKLERKKVLMEEKSVTAGKPRMTLEESFEHALNFLSSSWKI